MADTIKFKDLKIGDRFTFVGEHKFSGWLQGPWVKTSTRKYRYADKGPNEHTVDSGDAEVVKA